MTYGNVCLPVTCIGYKKECQIYISLEVLRFLRIAQPGCPTDRVYDLFLILPEDGSRIQRPKRCDFIYNLDDGQSPQFFFIF
jgi:hypothetical protein